jgi:hypothetical protein
MTALQVLVATICLFQMTRDAGNISGATAKKNVGSYRSTAEHIGTLGISSSLRMVCYILLGCPMLLGCFRMLSWNGSGISGRINQTVFVDTPLKSLFTTWSHHCHVMRQQPTGVWMLQASKKGPSEKLLDDAFHDALPLATALVSLVVAQLHVHYMCLHEHSCVHNTTLRIGSLHPRKYVRAILFGLLVLCPTGAECRRAAMTEGSVKLGASGSRGGNQHLVEAAGPASSSTVS